MRRRHFLVISLTAIVGTAAALPDRAPAQAYSQAQPGIAPQTPARVDREIRCERPLTGRDIGVDSSNEVTCLKQLAGIASRQGDQLRIKLTNGTTRSFRSEPQACKATDNTMEKCISYRLAGFNPTRQTVLIYVTLYEGSYWLLVSRRTGNKIELLGPPYFSPGGNRLVAMSCDETGERDCAMVIWSVKNDPATQEWRQQGAFEFGGWRGDDRVAVKSIFEEGKPVEAVLVNGKWELMPPAATR